MQGISINYNPLLDGAQVSLPVKAWVDFFFIIIDYPHLIIHCTLCTTEPWTFDSHGKMNFSLFTLAKFVWSRTVSEAKIAFNPTDSRPTELSLAGFLFTLHFTKEG